MIFVEFFMASAGHFQGAAHRGARPPAGM